MFEAETVRAVDPGEVRGARFAPFGFVVARRGVVVGFQPVEDRLGFEQRSAVAVVGEVAGYDDERQRVGVDLVHGPTQVFGPRRAGRKVQVAQQGEPESLGPARKNEEGREQKCGKEFHETECLAGCTISAKVIGIRRNASRSGANLRASP